MRAFSTAILAAAVLIAGCELPSLPAPPLGAGGVGSNAGGSGGAGGDMSGSGGGVVGPCQCEALPECADPTDFALWCGANGPGVHPAINCDGCEPTECARQPGPISACLGAQLWCCAEDFNPTPTAKGFFCSGDIMCETDQGVFTILCDYETTVSALDSTEAKQALLKDCQGKHPEYPCGLWSLECYAL